MPLVLLLLHVSNGDSH